MGKEKVYKVYVAYKPCERPVLYCKFREDGPWNNMSESGIGYYEDEVGYYSIKGELICSID
jgi:hypothetical protein